MDKMRTSGCLLSDQIERSLMQYIVSKPLKIGDRLPNEYELAQFFGVSRSTIRESVKSLVSQGVLEVKRGSGTYVCNLRTLDDDPLCLSKQKDKFKLAFDLLEVRLMLEPEIASRTAQNATPDDIAQLKILCNDAEQDYLNQKNHIPKDIEFHNYIARCSGNTVVENLIPIINTAVVTFANLTHCSLIRETIETHRAICNAIAAGDSLGAKYAMNMHLTYNRQALLELKREEDGYEKIKIV